MTTRLSDKALSSICEVISANMGLSFPRDRWDILRRNISLASARFGFTDIVDFHDWLLTATLKKAEIETLASFLTIAETYFWREPQVFSALTDFILPGIMEEKKNTQKSIRIWSAGCSTGEEAYSLAIALHKTIPELADWKIKILATDINPNALNKAISGVYTRWSFRNCPAWLKTRYFIHLGEGKYEIVPEIRRMVHFANLNLTEDVFPSGWNNTYSMDMIFCRNVLMYFTEEWIAKISDNFYNSLNMDGWFVVSSCELSSQLFSQFITVNYPGAIFYRKGNKDMEKSISGPVKGSVRDISFNLVPDMSLFPDTLLNYSLPFTVEPLMAEAVTATDKGTEKNTDTVRISDNPATESKIRLLADQGNLMEALSLCNQGIAVDKLAAGLYFLRASILQELGKTDEAIASVKQSVYLDPNFIMGHFALGNLYFRHGHPVNARRHFKNVLDLLNGHASDEILPESDGLSAKHIREIVLAHLHKHTIL